MRQSLATAILCSLLILLACTPSNQNEKVDKKGTTAEKVTTVSQELLIQTQKTDLLEIIPSFEQYDLQILSKIAPNMTIWKVLLQYNPSAHSLDAIMSDIRSHSAIIEVQTNKAVNNRK